MRTVLRRLAIPMALSLTMASASAGEDAPPMRLVPLKEGLRRSGPQSSVRREAREVGLELDAPEHPLVAHRYRDGKLFYVFYKRLEEAFHDRPGSSSGSGRQSARGRPAKRSRR